MRWTRFLSILAAGCVLGAVGMASSRAIADDADPKGLEFFEKNIRPVLVQQCYKCHSAEGKVKGGLLLDTRAGIRQGGESGHAVVPGNIEESLLVSALKHEDFEMPPGNKLSDDIVANFETWIKMGAPDPREGKSIAGGKRVIDIEAGRKFWAFQPVQQPVAPKVTEASWPRTVIDQFVLAGIEANGLHPVPDATPSQLIRRAYFDLTGLPPSSVEMLDWTKRLTKGTTANGVNQAEFAKLIDGLLASRQFGERWGRHWLDIVRYADSNGNVDNTPFPHAWRYRNWVINAFHTDIPYNEFLTQQLAGDLLPFDSPAQRNQQLIATGFLALGSKPRAQNNPNYQMDVVAEQIEVTTSAMLGLTVGCARCHDHKFDPIPTAEFYSLAGIFNSTNTLYGTAARGNNGRGNVDAGLVSLVDLDPATLAAREEFNARESELLDQQQKLTKKLAKMGVSIEKPKNNKKLNNQQKNQIKKLQNQLANLEQNNGKPKQIKRIKERLAQLGVILEPQQTTINEDDSEEVKTLKGELQEVVASLNSLRENSPPPVPKAMGATEGKPADCAICLAGESTDRGPVMPRGVISVVMTQPFPEIPESESGRLQLADWVTSPDNPLTARVMANRVWHHLIGKGIVGTVDNFGELGERPTHPELLDHLATKLVEENWSVKQLIRTVMMSRTYQLGSNHDAADFAKDPDNVWFWRMDPRRLDAEELRDAILSFSGQLTLTQPEPPEFAANGRNQAPVVRADGTHRSVYLPIVRNGEPEVLTLFDFADPSIVVGAREETTVPAQSLYLMNSPFVVNQSRLAAQTILRLPPAERLTNAFLAAYGRLPTDEQRTRSEEFLREMQTTLKESEQNEQRCELAAWSAFCQSLIASAEFRYLD